MTEAVRGTATIQLVSLKTNYKKGHKVYSVHLGLFMHSGLVLS